MNEAPKGKIGRLSKASQPKAPPPGRPQTTRLPLVGLFSTMTL